MQKSVNVEDVLQILIDKGVISEKDIQKHIEKKQKKTNPPNNKEKIPLTIFNSGLSPLESIVRYLKETKLQRTSSIAKLLSKTQSAISLAYKNSLQKEFSFKPTKYVIPINIFSQNKHLSILEAVVFYLKQNGKTLAEISEIIDRDPRTIWTLFDRAKKKDLNANKK